MLGYWELSKRRGVDISPLAAVTLTQLLTIVAKVDGLRERLGFNRRKEINREIGRVPEFRNRIMHPVRPLILEQMDVGNAYSVARFVENVRNSLPFEERPPFGLPDLQLRRQNANPTLAEKLEWLKPAPATAYENDCAAKVPQGDYEIGVQVTNDILDEAMEVFVRSSRSYFGVSGDSMVAIFTANGDLVNASCGTYLHAIIQPIVIKFIQKYYQQNPGIREGDIWYTNDALYGGIHNPDQVALMPVFHKGQLLAWAPAARTPPKPERSNGRHARQREVRFEEGLNLPPMRSARTSSPQCFRDGRFMVFARPRCSSPTSGSLYDRGPR